MFQINRAVTTLSILFMLAMMTPGGKAFAETPALLDLTFPSLELDPGQSPFRASADLGAFPLPLINVTNPNGDRYTTVRIVAWSAETGQSRWVLVGLEPGGSSTLSLEGAERFAHLSFFGNEDYSVELSNAADDRRYQVPVFRDGGLPTKSATCSGTWKLTCVSGGCSGLGPFEAAGRVENGNKVYWNQNTPTETPWMTIGDQMLTAEWAPGSDSCPVSVENMPLGHVYDVEILAGGGGGGGGLGAGHN